MEWRQVKVSGVAPSQSYAARLRHRCTFRCDFYPVGARAGQRAHVPSAEHAERRRLQLDGGPSFDQCCPQRPAL